MLESSRRRWTNAASASRSGRHSLTWNSMLSPSKLANNSPASLFCRRRVIALAALLLVVLPTILAFAAGFDFELFGCCVSGGVTHNAKRPVIRWLSFYSQAEWGFCIGYGLTIGSRESFLILTPQHH